MVAVSTDEFDVKHILPTATDNDQTILTQSIASQNTQTGDCSETRDAIPRYTFTDEKDMVSK